jgi:hypothetical protein
MLEERKQTRTQLHFTLDQRLHTVPLRKRQLEQEYQKKMAISSNRWDEFRENRDEVRKKFIALKYRGYLLKKILM